MAGRDTPKGPEAEGRLTLAEIATMGMPIESILEQLVQEPNADHAADIINLGAGMDQAFRDTVRHAFSRSPRYALLRHLSLGEIRQLSRVMGDAVAANLREYTRQFPNDYHYLYYELVLRPSVLEKILGRTELLKHRAYRDMIRNIMVEKFRQLETNNATYLQDTRILRLMSLVGMPLNGTLREAIRVNNLDAARYAITELGQRVTPLIAYDVVMDGLRITQPEMFRFVTENAGDDIDGRVRDGMRRIVSWHGHPEFADAARSTSTMITIIITFLRLVERESQFGHSSLYVDRYRRQLQRSLQNYDAYVASIPE